VRQLKGSVLQALEDERIGLAQCFLKDGRSVLGHAVIQLYPAALVDEMGSLVPKPSTWGSSMPNRGDVLLDPHLPLKELVKSVPRKVPERGYRRGAQKQVGQEAPTHRLPRHP
jgi:hypothetical protein